MKKWGGQLDIRPPHSKNWGGRVPPIPPRIDAPECGHAMLTKTSFNKQKTEKHAADGNIFVQEH